MAISFYGAKKYKKHNGLSPKMTIAKPLPSQVHKYLLWQGDTHRQSIVKEGDSVLCGQKIADVEDFNAMSVISSVSGTVKTVTDKEIVIENDMSYTPFVRPQSPDIDRLTTREKLWLLREGAVFEARSLLPLHVMLAEKTVSECIIVCCFDSDPYVSSPQAACIGNEEKIISALTAAMEIAGINKAYIAVETDTKQTYRNFKYHLRFNERISLYALKPRYPQSRTDKLVKAVTGKSMIRAMILSPETLVNMYSVLFEGGAVTSKLVTLSGDDILEPKNYAVPIGSSVMSLLESGGYHESDIVICGGVIDGAKITDTDAPVDETFKSVLAFKNEQAIPEYRKKPL